MKAALDLPLPSVESLRGGFWPTSRFSPSEADQFHEDGTLREEFARDVGRCGDRPAESFRVARDVYAGYFLAIWPTGESTNHPF